MWRCSDGADEQEVMIPVSTSGAESVTAVSSMTAAQPPFVLISDEDEER